VLAFDTGPGNILIDALVTLLTGGIESFDRDGFHAAHGTVDAAMLAELMRDPYLARRPPKTTGRELYGMAQARAWIAARGLPARRACAGGMRVPARPPATWSRR